MTKPKPKPVYAVPCRRCHKPVEREIAVPFTLYVAGDVATWICPPCVFELTTIAEQLRRGLDVNHPVARPRSQRVARSR
jgi:hypothetical protein